MRPSLAVLTAAVPMHSVTSQEIVDAIFQQTGRKLERKDVELPDVSTVGTYQASIRLHPEVLGTFNVVVQREKNA
jgi:large subunit ribosomal protein L9